MNGMVPARDTAQVRLILSTVGSEEDALRLSKLWVESHRAVCVTRIPGARSVYPWQGEIQEESEVLLLIKTSVRDEEQLEDLLLSMAADHPYEEPELLVFAADGGAKGYLDWILAWRSAASDSTEAGA
jgi:periplasmic divalent cation tolerance protein